MTLPPTLAKELDAARLYSAPSTRVLIAAGYFSVAGIFAGVSVFALTAMSLTTSIPPGLTVLTFATGLGLRVVTVAGLLWTARALRQREMAGWYAGLFTVASPFLGALLDQPLNVVQIALSAIGMALLAIARRDLR